MPNFRSLGLAPGNPGRRAQWIIASISASIAMGVAWQFGAFEPSFPEFTVPSDRVVIFSPRGTEYLTLSSRELEEYSLAGEALWKCPLSAVHQACYLPESRQVATDLGPIVVLWDRATREATSRIDLPNRERWSGLMMQMRPSPDGRWLAIWRRRDGYTMLVDLKAERNVGTLPADNMWESSHRENFGLSEVAFRSSPNQLIRIQNGGSEIWDLEPLHRRNMTDFPATTFSGGFRNQEISDHGEYLATTSLVGRMQLWDLRINREIGVREINSVDRFSQIGLTERPSTSCCYCAGDNILVTNGAWDRRKLNFNSSFPFLAFDNDYGRVITAWDLKTLQPIRTWHTDLSGDDFLHPIAGTNDFIAPTGYGKCSRFRIR